MAPKTRAPITTITAEPEAMAHADNPTVATEPIMTGRRPTPSEMRPVAGAATAPARPMAANTMVVERRWSPPSSSRAATTKEKKPPPTMA